MRILSVVSHVGKNRGGVVPATTVRVHGLVVKNAVVTIIPALLRILIRGRILCLIAMIASRVNSCSGRPSLGEDAVVGKIVASIAVLCREVVRGARRVRASTSNESRVHRAWGIDQHTTLHNWPWRDHWHCIGAAAEDIRDHRAHLFSVLRNSWGGKGCRFSRRSSSGVRRNTKENLLQYRTVNTICSGSEFGSRLQETAAAVSAGSIVRDAPAHGLGEVGVRNRACTRALSERSIVEWAAVQISIH